MSTWRLYGIGCRVLFMSKAIVEQIFVFIIINVFSAASEDPLNLFLQCKKEYNEH